MIQPRGTLSTRRMTAHRVVLAAAGLTTLVAAAIGAALAVFVGQGLPLAVRHDLSVAPGTALSIAGPVSNDGTTATASTLRTAVGRSLGGVPFGFWSGTWSDPLELVPGSLPAQPARAAKGNMPLLEAAALDGITSHGVLVSGHWPAAPAASQAPHSEATHAAAASYEVPAALPASAAALLHLSPGDVVTLKDGISGARIRFRITGLFAPRRLSGTGGSYWALDAIPASGSSIQSGYTAYGPLLVSPAAFAPTASSTGTDTSTGSETAGALTARTGTWLAQPDLEKFTAADMSMISGDVSALQQALLDSSVLSGMQLSTSLPSVLSATASKLFVARSLLVISALLRNRPWRRSAHCWPATTPPPYRSGSPVRVPRRRELSQLGLHPEAAPLGRTRLTACQATLAASMRTQLTSVDVMCSASRTSPDRPWNVIVIACVSTVHPSTPLSAMPLDISR